MNKDTVYRQDAIDTLMAILDRPNHAEFLYTDEICKALGQLPSAQPKIVQCKDCIYHAGWNYCEEVDGLWYDDDFCCHGEKGERREEE